MKAMLAELTRIHAFVFGGMAVSWSLIFFALVTLGRAQ